MDFDLTELWNEHSATIIAFALNLLLTFVILIVGLWVIKRLVSALRKILTKRNVDPTLIPTLVGVARIGLITVLLIAVIERFGADTTGLVAVLGGLSLALGLALQGSLSNFAGGMLILTLKPFKAGDFVEVNGESGTVHSVTIIHTILRTTDNKIIYLPNGAVANSNVTNFSHEEKRRWDKVFGIDYADDFEKAKKIIQDLLAADERIHKDPAPFVRVTNLGDSSVDIQVRAWTNTSELWNVNFDMIEKVKLEFDKQGISFPFPQRDVHVYNEK